MSDMFLGSQAPLYQNVTIRRRAKSGKILEERHAKNRVTRLMLYGIGKFLLGQFNNSSPDKIYEYIPRYLALGSNTVGVDASTTNVTTVSSVNDTRLLNEFTKASTTGATESIARINIAERNMCKLNTKFSDPFIKVSIKTYVSSTHYDGLSIGEAGLFSKEKDNNCLARVCFAPIVKNPGEVLDIQWDITLLSYGETKYPEKLEIENGSKIVIPLKYTNKKFKEIKSGLKYFWASSTIGTDTDNELFYFDPITGLINTNKEINELKNSDWYAYLKNNNLENLFETFVNQIINSKLNDVSNPLYLESVRQEIPTMFYFGNLYQYLNMEIINSDELAICLLYSEDKVYNYEETGYSYSVTDTSDEYIITSPTGLTNEYKVKQNQIYKKNEKEINSWVALDYYMYNGVIINGEYEEVGYSYNNGLFYKSDFTINDTFTKQYLSYSLENTANKSIYSLNVYNILESTGYTIDFNDHGKIYLDGEYSSFHISNDNYWVMGDYIKLIPIIYPSDSTDKSVTWILQNKDVATVNWDGVVQGWNIGETTAVVSTSNDLRAKCIVQVVKETKFIDIDNISVNPTEALLLVDGDANQEIIISATIDPIFATNSTVNWAAQYSVADCISLINLGNNKVKVVLNGSNNLGSGYITATSQSGKSASCLLRVLYEVDGDNCDCDDESHLLQEK